MFITPNQIRAGRALLGWSQRDLATRARITQVTVTNIESGRTVGTRATFNAVQIALENEGIEFIENGVRRCEDYLNIWAGDDAYLRLLDDIYFSLKASKGEALFLGADERKTLPGVVDSVRRIKNAGIRTRLLIEENNFHILGELKDYRQIPSRFFSNAVSVVYGDKYALLVIAPAGHRVYVIRNEQALSAQRGIFEFFWEHGVEPTQRTARQEY